MELRDNSFGGKHLSISAARLPEIRMVLSCRDVRESCFIAYNWDSLRILITKIAFSL